ncbi:MAG: RNA methyltransferase [Sandaracinaceae bacterium]|nr:RNA methyltransferase [Sandaracinaceae bacterium]MBK7774338.1 RNA methyltransferase [Sandaracinaceae bacterium]MBK8408890.1 RNA methyltransferase [Sandaracinaceae bacterium]MBK8590688.1 RNA methyltransferase [Sandaracinaceae bacterium]
MSRRVYCALVHHPVKDRDGATVATSITNLDVHDIARSSRTYGLAGYYLVSPITAQHAIVDRILDHWRPGQAGAGRVPQRAEALRLIEVTRSIEESIAHIQAREGQAPRVWATGARAPEGKAILSFVEGSRVLHDDPGVPTLILFGTGHGLTNDTVLGADAVLAPIRAGSDYNHLSVRAAAAIIFDRLFGEG